MESIDLDGATLKKAYDTELSDDDLNALLPGIVITQYNELEGKTLGNIVNDNGIGIVLFVQKETPTVTAGHWLAVGQRSDGVVLFDPYGGYRDPWFLGHTWVSNKTLKALDQDRPLLSSIITASGMRPLYNEHRLQKMAPGIDTCGRHCVVRLWNLHMDNDEYANWLIEEGWNPDKTVTEMTFAKLGH
jgi:hypothetical protein